MDIDFGVLGFTSVNQNIGPIIMAPAISTFSYNTGLGLSTIMHNEIVGKPMDFLWTVHTWDDQIHTVAE